TVLLGGKSLGIYRHWQPVPNTYIRPFTRSRAMTSRLRPPRRAGGMSGASSAHSASVTSLGYRRWSRSYRARFSSVHFGASSNQTAHIRITTDSSESRSFETDTDQRWKANRLALF